MTRSERDRKRLKAQILKHMEEVLAGGGVTRQQLADELHVTRQAISSYLAGRTTPKAHVVARLLNRWPSRYAYRGVEFGPEDFGPIRQDSVALPERQASLLDVLSSVKKDNMRVEVERGRGNGAELRIILKIAGERRT